MTIKPLAGIRVLDMTALPPGAYCTIQLADFGADIIRIEPPSQAGRRSLVVGQVGLSRGKRSITLDSRKPQGVAVLKRLAATADVLIENATPGTMAERGFGYPQAAQETPRLIWCSVTGFGQDGPYADRAGHDLSYVGHSGLLNALAPELPWQPQTMLAVPVGAMMSTIGIFAALAERQRTGRGCQIDISLSEAATWLLSGASYHLSNASAGFPESPGRRLYACGDGEFISVAAAEPRTWKALCDTLQLPDLVDRLDVSPAENAATTARLSALFASRPAAAWVDLLGPAGAAVNAVNRGRAVIDDPHNRARGTMVQVGSETVPGNPVRLRNADGERSSTATEEPPLVGAHNDAVYQAAGFSVAEIIQLKTDGVI